MKKCNSDLQAKLKELHPELFVKQIRLRKISNYKSSMYIGIKPHNDSEKKIIDSVNRFTSIYRGEFDDNNGILTSLRKKKIENEEFMRNYRKFKSNLKLFSFDEMLEEMKNKYAERNVKLPEIMESEGKNLFRSNLLLTEREQIKELISYKVKGEKSIKKASNFLSKLQIELDVQKNKKKSMNKYNIIAGNEKLQSEFGYDNYTGKFKSLKKIKSEICSLKKDLRGIRHSIKNIVSNNNSLSQKSEKICESKSPITQIRQKVLSVDIKRKETPKKIKNNYYILKRDSSYELSQKEIEEKQKIRLNKLYNSISHNGGNIDNFKSEAGKYFKTKNIYIGSQGMNSGHLYEHIDNSRQKANEISMIKKDINLRKVFKINYDNQNKFIDIIDKNKPVIEETENRMFKVICDPQNCFY